jgi:hypothetical protein
MVKQVILTHVQSMASATSTTTATLILPRLLPRQLQIQPTILSGSIMAMPPGIPIIPSRSSIASMEYQEAASRWEI